jgi:hypothetical protein
MTIRAVIVAGAAAIGLQAVWFTSNARAIPEVEALLAAGQADARRPDVARRE